MLKLQYSNVVLMITFQFTDNITNYMEIKEKLKIKDNLALEKVYDENYPVIERMVLSNSGNKDDAKDVFQDTMVAWLKNVQKADFELTSSLQTYLYSIARNIWLNNLRRNKFEQSGISEIPGISADNSSFEIADEYENNTGIIKKMFSRISDHCRTLLQKMFYENRSIENIMSIFGYKSKHSAVNQKYKCLEQIRKTAGINYL